MLIMSDELDAASQNSQENSDEDELDVGEKNDLSNPEDSGSSSMRNKLPGDSYPNNLL